MTVFRSSSSLTRRLLFFGLHLLVMILWTILSIFIVDASCISYIIHEDNVIITSDIPVNGNTACHWQHRFAYQATWASIRKIDCPLGRGSTIPIPKTQFPGFLRILCNITLSTKIASRGTTPLTTRKVIFDSCIATDGQLYAEGEVVGSSVAHQLFPDSLGHYASTSPLTRGPDGMNYILDHDNAPSANTFSFRLNRVTHCLTITSFIPQSAGSSFTRCYWERRTTSHWSLFAVIEPAPIEGSVVLIPNIEGDLRIVCDWNRFEVIKDHRGRSKVFPVSEQYHSSGTIRYKELENA